jgi:HAD superfamily phosphatase
VNEPSLNAALGGSLRAQMLVFDMDGVLVDVTESYRETIVRTVDHFTGKTISRDSIQEYKNQGGWNNDWLLSQKICRDLGVDLPYATIVEYFNYLFLDQGMIHRERWLPRDGLLDRLGERFDFAIFTGRTTEEAEITLKREGVRDRFLLVSANDVECEKPAPDGLLKIAAMHPGKKLLYIGDTVDDARCAKAAYVPFIGIAARQSPRREELVNLLRLEGAIQVIEDINEIG